MANKGQFYLFITEYNTIFYNTFETYSIFTYSPEYSGRLQVSSMRRIQALYCQEFQTQKPLHERHWRRKPTVTEV